MKSFSISKTWTRLKLEAHWLKCYVLQAVRIIAARLDLIRRTGSNRTGLSGLSRVWVWGARAAFTSGRK